VKVLNVAILSYEAEVFLKLTTQLPH